MHAQDTEDWVVTEEGLYVATRGFLIRRGYCCASRCRNCPYINWRENPDWQPIPEDEVQYARVASRSLAAARFLLKQHEEALLQENNSSHDYHRRMAHHYRALLAHWKER